MTCVMCQIRDGEVDAWVIWRSSSAFAFVPLEEGMLGPGHTLVAPLEHWADLLDAPADGVGEVLAAARLVAEACVAALGADGVNLLHNSGRAAGQSIPHLHLHLVPRWSDDGLETWPRGRSGRQLDPKAYTTLGTWLSEGTTSPPAQTSPP